MNTHLELPAFDMTFRLEATADARAEIERRTGGLDEALQKVKKGDRNVMFLVVLIAAGLYGRGERGVIERAMSRLNGITSPTMAPVICRYLAMLRRQRAS